MHKALNPLLIIAVLILGAYTQFFHFTAVPGLHFDEAWQGNFAYRIMAEPGFFPTEAMNSYTSPVIHYFLAGVFKLFGPSLEVMRSAYAVMNALTLLLFCALLLRMHEARSAFWFALSWALLPLSIHNHRFYVEMTGFYGLCFALVVWGVALWKEKPALSVALLTAPTVLATYSHILFISVFATALIVLPWHFKSEMETRRARYVIALIAALLIPTPVRMGAGLHKALPFVLAGALATVAVMAVSGRKIFFHPQKARISFLIAGLPFLLPFTALLWNGFWPYAQATGTMQLAWLPINMAIFIGLGWMAWKKRSHDFFSDAFIVSFLITSVLIFKQSPRYYMVPVILGMLWTGRLLAMAVTPSIQAALAFGFVAWNFTMFHTAYIQRFENAGPTTAEFRLGIFHDNARDFRPFQKVFQWAIENNCQQELRWVEDDRFGHPIDFLRLTAPEPKGQCLWQRDNLFFSHIPDYDPKFTEARTEQNTPPPVPNVKFLAHFREWGDLALWIRRW